MSAAHFEIVRTDAGWHLRLVGGNGEPVVSSEVYTESGTAVDAIAIVAETIDAIRAGGPIAEFVDERPEPEDES